MIHNIVNQNFAQTGSSTRLNFMGMREMQERAYEIRDAQYILLKAPPASGKSRALMYIALDKLINQGIRKVIVAVPQKAIGGSFKNTDLCIGGFFANWEIKPCNNLVGENEYAKVKAFSNFMNGPDKILVCTHATLRNALEKIDLSKFDNTLVAIDEFHHVSADTTNKLGEQLRELMAKTSAHVVAMTGSYFRGDSLPILLPEDEERVTNQTYTYYEQLNGYTYLKSLGIGYNFYKNQYTSAIEEVLDTDKKTIIHIPHTNARESFGKLRGVGQILEIIGEVVSECPETGIHTVKRRKDGKLLKVADLVEDSDKALRDRTLAYLREIKSRDDLDIIIAMGMAKEGFDWTFCETALRIGYRNSFTEIIQIIGRATRDCEGKTHAQFINLVAEPDATSERVTEAVNDMLKAITVSLLMEQVLAPNFKFKTRLTDEQQPKAGEILIRGLKEPTSKRVKVITENDLNDLKAAILDDKDIQAAIVDQNIPPQVINRELIPKIIWEKYPELTEEQVEEVRQQLIADIAIKSCVRDENDDLRFVHSSEKFVNIRDLHIDLIDNISPFQAAYQIHSKKLSPAVFKAIKDNIDSSRIAMTEEEALLRFTEVKAFMQIHRREPNHKSADAKERRLGEAWIYIKRIKQQRDAKG
jgi:superfamily II DNA or RNA helicase